MSTKDESVQNQQAPGQTPIQYVIGIEQLNGFVGNIGKIIVASIQDLEQRKAILELTQREVTLWASTLKIQPSENQPK